MKTSVITTKLERKGYSITYLVSGGVMITKNQFKQFYTSLNDANNKLFK